MSRFIVFLTIIICLINEILTINGNTTAINDNLTNNEVNSTDVTLIRSKRDCAKGKYQRSNKNVETSVEESPEYDYVEDNGSPEASIEMPKKKTADPEQPSTNTFDALTIKLDNLIQLINMLILAAENNIQKMSSNNAVADLVPKPVSGTRRIQTVENELARKMSTQPIIKTKRRNSSPKIEKRKNLQRKTVEWSGAMESKNMRKSNNH